MTHPSQNNINNFMPPNGWNLEDLSRLALQFGVDIYKNQICAPTNLS
jgi:hypothetical protein